MSPDFCVQKKNFEFPECWNNDVRMSALFAPFRSKSLNPTDWTSKMTFWTNLIENWCKHHKCPVVEISDFKNKFSRKGVLPACLDEVFQQLNRTGILIPKDNFLTNETWKSWAVKVLVMNPLKWTFDTVKSTIGSRIDSKETIYIHFPVIKFLSKELVKSLPPSCQGKLISHEELVDFWDIENVENMYQILDWMKKEGTVSIIKEKGQTLLKFAKSGANEVEITETDRGIFNLEKQEKLLEESIKKLEVEKNLALEDTKRHISNKMKDLAVISLRRKKEIEKTISKRAVTLENIQAILHQIDQVKLDSDVVKCYQKGISTLKRIFKETGLSEETVTSTMSELQDVLNSRNEIENALSKPMEPYLEEDLKAELQELLMQDAPEVPLNNSPKETLIVKEKKIKNTDELDKRLEALSI